MLLSSPCCYQALRVKTSKLQSLIQMSKPLGQALLLEVTSPWSNSIGWALLSSSETTLRKENPCSFPGEFASHYTMDFWDLIFSVSLHSALKLSCQWARLNCIWERHAQSEWNTLPKTHPPYGKQGDCISCCSSLSWILKPQPAWKAPLLLQHFLVMTINKSRILICCNKVISSCTLPVRDLVQQSLLSAGSHSFSMIRPWLHCQLMEKSIWNNLFDTHKPNSSL